MKKKIGQLLDKIATNDKLTSSVGPKLGLTAALDTRMSSLPNFEMVYGENSTSS